jgi:SAM-dependent methyltransferase
MGMADFAFSERTYGCYSYYRGFYSSEVVQANDSLLDIGCGDGFFTKRFLSAKCKHVDGIDIEPSAIECAKKNNSAENIKYHLLDAVAVNFPEKDYDVIVWDGAIGHFSPGTLDMVLAKIADALSEDGVFVGSESLGQEGSDHLTQFNSLDDLGNLFSKYFRYVEISSQDYEIHGNFLRQEAYWRCANQSDRLQNLTWKKYYRR